MGSSMKSNNNNNNNNSTTKSNNNNNTIHNHHHHQRNNATTTVLFRRSVVERTKSFKKEILILVSNRQRFIIFITCGLYFLIILWRFLQSIHHNVAGHTVTNTKKTKTVSLKSSFELKSTPPTTNNNQRTTTTKSLLLSDRICYNGINSIMNEKIQLVALDFDETIISIHTGGVWEGSSSQLVQYVRPEMICLLYNCIYQYKINVAITTFSTQKQLIQNVLRIALTNYYYNNNNYYQQQTQQHEQQRRPEDNNKNKNSNNIENSNTSNLPQKILIPVFGWDDHIRGYDYGKQSQLYLARQYYYYNNKNYTTKNDKLQQQQQQQPKQKQSKQQKFVRKHQRRQQQQQQQQRRQQEKDYDDNDNNNNIVPLRQHTVLIDDDYENIRIAQIDGYRTIHYNLDNMKNENILVLKGS